MKFEIIKTYWRDNANPYPGRLTGTEARAKKRKCLVPPELIAGRIGALPLSRDEKNRNYRSFTRKLSEADRRFVVALRRVVERIKGPTTCHQEKICKALKIKGRMYRLRMNGLPK